MPGTPRSGPLREAMRLRVWEAHEAGDGLGTIAAREKVAKSAVQYIIKQIRSSGRIAIQKPKGRPSKLNKQCVCLLYLA
jgi:transposase